ncbi:MAG TPA: hypothetical protein PK431_06230 [Chitinophagales bacterium]|nr:hypothetical protein [Chitinophagales bacterium]
MYQLQFTLKQHTPIIHFQHIKDGATLRATELKPKLDRFIIEKMGGKQKMDKSWFNDFERGSLNYKMKIIATDLCQTVIEEGRQSSPPFFFGNMGEEYKKNKKYLNWSDTPLKLTLTIVNNKSVIFADKLKEYFPEFLLVNNFGTRQNKGWGSFYLHENTENYVSYTDIIQKQNTIKPNSFQYFFDININLKSNDVLSRATEALRNLEIFYKAIKSGHNKCFGRDQFYLKPILWLYYKNVVEKDIKWEKRKIKEKALSRFLVNQENMYSEAEDSPVTQKGKVELAIKDLLGYTTDEKWSAMYNNANIAKSMDGIDRYQSPITFKPILQNNGYKVLVILKDTPELLLNKDISFNVNNVDFKMKTPAVFNVNNVFKFIADKSKFNLDNHFLLKINEDSITVSNYKRDVSINEYRVLQNIFNQLQNR